jgi:hypothetical protein
MNISNSPHLVVANMTFFGSTFRAAANISNLRLESVQMLHPSYSKRMLGHVHPAAPTILSEVDPAMLKGLRRKPSPTAAGSSFVMRGALFSTEIYTRGCHLFPRLLHLKLLHACDQCHSSRVSTFLTSSHCKLRPNTEGAVLVFEQCVTMCCTRYNVLHSEDAIKSHNQWFEAISRTIDRHIH